MDQIPAFLISIVIVSLIIPRLGPFLSLVLSSIVYGLLCGMEPDLMAYITTGLSRMFSSLVIVVFSGAVIAEYLRKTGSIDRIVFDLQKISGRSLLVSGIAGYVVALPVMCSVTAYMILDPVVSALGKQTEGSARRRQFMTAVCSIISFNLIYPSPVMVSLSGTLDLKPYELLSVGLPISLILFAIAYLYMRRLPTPFTAASPGPAVVTTRFKAWAPLILPMVLILMGAAEAVASKAGWIELIGNPSIALLIGALLCVALAQNAVQEIIRVASRRSGVIMLDLCGAGAFGYVISQSGLGRALYDTIGPALPAIVLPFLISSILQLAQGSRVVTVVVSAQILQSFPMDELTMAFLICAGAFMFSYISDPYFWLVKESTRSNMLEMIRGYTFPLSLLGIATFAATVVYSIWI